MAFFKFLLFIGSLREVVRKYGSEKEIWIFLFSVALPSPMVSDQHAKVLFLLHFFFFINPLLLFDSGTSRSGVYIRIQGSLKNSSVTG